MKIRMGFVGNSSSSSFIVAFDKKPEMIEEVQKLLFGEEEFFATYDDEKVYTTKEMAQTVFKGLAKKSAT